MISLGLDCGTQSTKCIALDAESGDTLASAQQEYDFVPGLPPGHLEQNPNDWTAAANTVIAEVLKKLGDRRLEVCAIGVSAQQHGLVVLDEKYQVVRPAKLWCDTSTAAECDEITAALGGTDGVIAACGNAMLPGYTLPKILWLKRHEPENFARARWFLLPHDYLNFWLTGMTAMEYGDASGTALLDVRTRQWSTQLADAVDPGLLEKLPGLHSSTREAGYVSGHHLQEWGLEDAPLVSAGGGDNMMGAIGTGNVSPGVVTASLGTSGTLYAFSSSPVVDPKGEVAAFCDSTDNWLPLACTMNITLVTELVREMASWSHEDFDAALGRTPPGADGLLLLPYLTGERTPNLPGGCGVLYGLRVDNTTMDHLARAAVEGVTLGLAYGLSRFRELGIEPSEIRLTGGGSNSAAWRQICADIFGVPVVCLRSAEGSALGAAVQAAWTYYRTNGSDAALRDFTDRLVILDETTRAEPKPGATSVYPALLQRAQLLRTTLAGAGLL